VVKKPAYVPDRGDLVWLDFDPQAGHEQAGRRSALVISPKAYNLKVGLAIFFPISIRVKGYPFEVVVTGATISGVVLADQVKSLDWRARNTAFVERVPESAVAEVLGKLAPLVSMS
jgi:mRNA interferase MazF